MKYTATWKHEVESMSYEPKFMLQKNIIAYA